mgnify:FL=1
MKKATQQSDVIIPTIIKAIVEKVICISLFFSIQLDVPITWLEAPIAMPFAISLFILKNFKMSCENTAPNNPVKNTMQAVICGITWILLDV